MDNIQREIDTTFVVKMLDEYIEYSKLNYLTDDDKDAILRFLAHLIEKGDD